MKLKSTLAIIAVILSACGGSDDFFDISCDDDRGELVRGSGNPEEIQRYDSGDYHSWTYWYWSRGFSRTFTWGGAAGSCKTSDYTFSPIR